MNKNYRLLSFRSFFIFSFLSFFEGSPSSGFFFKTHQCFRVAGFFFGWGREAKNTVLPESFFTFRFFHFFLFLHFFTFLHFFLHFQIFSLFYIFTIFRFFHFFTFLHFYNFSEVTLVVVFFMWGDARKKFF